MRRPKPFAPNERDREIIWLAYDYRFVTVEILHALLGEEPRDGRVYGFGLHGLRARCQKLREHGYLVWQHLRDEPVGRGYRTERPMVYSVGPASIGVLAERTGLEPRQLKAAIAKNAVTSFFLRHQVGISRFRACLELACRASDGAVRIGTWLQDGLRDRVRVDVDGKEEVIPVVPDAVFNLFVRRADGRRNVSHYFLEYDTGTMSLKRIVRKAVGYELYLQEELHKHRYTYASAASAPPELRYVAKEWVLISPARRAEIQARSPRTFQVLFVISASSGDIRKSSAGELPARMRQRNIMNAISRAATSNGRFLFCSENFDFDLKHAQTPLSQIWRTRDGVEDRVSIVPPR